MRSHHAGGVEVRETVLCRARFDRRQAESSGLSSKHGDRYLRRILVVGAHAVLRRVRRSQRSILGSHSLACKPFRVVAVALANKMARIAWALLAKGGTYRAPAVAA